MNYTILQGDNCETLKTLADNSVDAIVTDPPYGIDFLGKSWDANTGALETYKECLRVLKPGGHILAFSAARTYHHLAITLEQAGFEIRDQIMWIYSSGFPKSQDIGKGLDKKGIDNEWSGWGTALKPAHEPIALARKPMKGSIRENVQKYGTGALNIDATRVGDPITYTNQSAFANNVALANNGEIKHAGATMSEEVTVSGRFPSNVLGEIPDYQKYFYCPKVSRKERHIGFENAETYSDLIASIPGAYAVNDTTTFLPGLGVIYNHGLKHEVEKIRGYNASGNNHPTVKPIELMKYLIKLITPPGGTVLDPFNGSGSTGCAAVELGHTYIGCELDPAYVEIAKKRIEAWYEETRDHAKEIFN